MPASAFVLPAVFLAHDSVAGALRFQNRSDGGLGLAIGLGHGRSVGLALGAPFAPEQRADNSARRIGETIGKDEVGVRNGHRVSCYGDGMNGASIVATEWRGQRLPTNGGFPSCADRA